MILLSNGGTNAHRSRAHSDTMVIGTVDGIVMLERAPGPRGGFGGGNVEQIFRGEDVRKRLRGGLGRHRFFAPARAVGTTSSTLVLDNDKTMHCLGCMSASIRVHGADQGVCGSFRAR